MWQEWAFYFVSPLTLVMLAGIAAAILWRWGRRPAAMGMAIAGFAILWVCSMTLTAHLAQSWLERGFTAQAAKDSPVADAIVVLGGAVAPAHPPRRPEFVLGPDAQRVWHAAALYRAGKARWVIVAAGNRNARPGDETEAAAIVEMLRILGVPPSAILAEGQSRTTRENAANVLPLLRSLGVRSILLVTSPYHMKRAMSTFGVVLGPGAFVVHPAVSATSAAVDDWTEPKLWLPSPDALLVVTRLLKEFAGMAVLAII